MSRRIAVIAAFMVAYAGLMTAQTVTGTINGVPVVSGSTVLLQNGPTTPNVTYGAPAPTAGISNAGRAGISNNQPLSSIPPTQPGTVVYYSQPSIAPMPTSLYGTELIAPTGATEMAPAAQPAENTGTIASPDGSGGRLVNDLGPSYYGEPSASASGQSLAQISADFKARKASGNARMLTNDEVKQMLNAKTGVTVAKNMPPLGPGPTPSGASANEVTGSSAAAPQSASAAAPQPQSNPAPPARGSGQPPAGTPPPVDTTQGQPAGTDAAAGNATTPSVNPNQESNDAQGKSRLPATATFLPLLGLLGVVSGGIGWAFRRFRK